jgi:hypothetical protein
MNKDMKKYLKVAATLTIIGTISALLITVVNLFAEPKIKANEAAAKAAGFKNVFTETQSVSDDFAVSGKYISQYNVCYSDAEQKTALGNAYTAEGSNSHVHGMKILIGMSGDKASPTLGKVYILTNGASAGYNNTVVNKYVNPYNSDPSDTTLNAVSCGATEAASLIKWMITEARDLYKSGGIAENIATELKTIYPTLAAYSDPVDLTGFAYAKSYYGIYGDAGKTSLIGTVYRLADDKTTLLVGFSGTHNAVNYAPSVIVTTTDTEIAASLSAYNAAPSAETLASASTSAQALISEAKTLYTTGYGNLTSEGPYLKAMGGYGALGTGVAVSDKTYVNSYWIAYSDEAKTTEKGYIFRCTGQISFEIYDGSTHTAHITLLVGVSGLADAPQVSSPVVTADDSFGGSGTPSSGATYSPKLIKDMVAEATQYYTTLKGGN